MQHLLQALKKQLRQYLNSSLWCFSSDKSEQVYKKILQNEAHSNKYWEPFHPIPQTSKVNPVWCWIHSQGQDFPFQRNSGASLWAAAAPLYRYTLQFVLPQLHCELHYHKRLSLQRTHKFLYYPVHLKGYRLSGQTFFLICCFVWFLCSIMQAVFS